MIENVNISKTRTLAIYSAYLQNFFPVSGLHFLSKVMEKVISQQSTTQHVNASNLNNEYQSVYRSQHITETAVLKVMNNWVWTNTYLYLNVNKFVFVFF